MNAYELDQWDAQQPPSDFAQRTAQAMLASSARGKWRGRRGRHAGWLLLCAALVGGTAWGMWRHQASESAAGVVPAQATAKPAAPSKIEPRGRAIAARPRVAQAEVPTTHPKQKPLATPSVSTAAAAGAATASSTASTTPPPFALQPRCTCEPTVMVCSCFD